MFWYVTGFNLLTGVEKQKEILKKAARYTFKAGDNITINLKNDFAYIITSGEVRWDVTTKTNQYLSLISLVKGECFGGITHDESSNINLIAVNETGLIELSFEQMVQIAKASDHILLYFHKGILRRKVEVSISPDTLIFKPAKLRLEEALQLLISKIGVHQRSSIYLKIRPTSERLAKMVGLGRLHTLLAIAELYGEHKLIPDIRFLIVPI
ncbi:MAG: hypothetical protein ACP5JP_07260 [bacterium]